MVHPDGRRELVQVVEKWIPAEYPATAGWAHVDTITGRTAYPKTHPADWHNTMHLDCNRELLQTIQDNQRADQLARNARPKTRRGTR